MTIYGELGPVERIKCTASPDTEIVETGAIMFPIPAADELESWVPANCPRKGTLNITQEIGCVGCGHAFIDYRDHDIADC